jgi:outer membrane protein assembly factor BamB
VFVGSDGGVLYALDAVTGGERWRNETGGIPIYSSPEVTPDGRCVQGGLVRALPLERLHKGEV